MSKNLFLHRQNNRSQKRVFFSRGLLLGFGVNLPRSGGSRLMVASEKNQKLPILRMVLQSVLVDATNLSCTLSTGTSRQIFEAIP